MDGTSLPESGSQRQKAIAHAIAEDQRYLRRLDSRRIFNQDARAVLASGLNSVQDKHNHRKRRSINVTKLHSLVMHIDKIADAEGVHKPEMWVIDDQDISSNAGYNRIYVTLRDLDKLSEENLKVVGTHELAHVLLEHSLQPNLPPHQKEYEADRLTALLLGDTSQVIALFRDIARKQYVEIDKQSGCPGSDTAKELLAPTKDHPSFRDRIRQLRAMINEPGLFN